MYKNIGFKDVEGYEGLYAVTTCGKVWSHTYNKWLKPGKDGDGYWRVAFCVNKKMSTKKVHRLVAQTYLENPLDKPYVNHLNGVKTCNNTNNLEWVTHGENTSHAFATGLLDNNKMSTRLRCIKAVLQIDAITGQVIREFPSIEEARKFLGLKYGKHISSCCKGKRNICGGYKWLYRDGYTSTTYAYTLIPNPFRDVSI